MIKEIMHDPLFLSKPSEDATSDDKNICQDLIDTLNAHHDACVGMAANMIGVRKNIIIVDMGFIKMIMINPKITNKKDMYQTEEGCLSLSGVRKCTRYNEIEVDYLDQNFEKKHGTYNGFVAQIIQHEIDHTNGILI